MKQKREDICSNCENPLPTVKDNETPYQFCTVECKEQYNPNEDYVEVL